MLRVRTLIVARVVVVDVVKLLFCLCCFRRVRELNSSNTKKFLDERKRVSCFWNSVYLAKSSCCCRKNVWMAVGALVDSVIVQKDKKRTAVLKTLAG